MLISAFSKLSSLPVHLYQWKATVRYPTFTKKKCMTTDSLLCLLAEIYACLIHYGLANSYAI